MKSLRLVKKLLVTNLSVFLFVVNSSKEALAELSAFDLELSELLQVSVYAPGKFEQGKNQSPSVVSIVTRDEIQAFGANSLLEILDRVTSINMLGSFFYPQNLAVIRGAQLTHSNNEVLVLINGRPMRDSFTGGQSFALFTSFPLDLIQQIEVIRGPGSALYGSNAFSGVINIKTAKTSDQHQLGLKTGSLDTRQVSYAGAGEAQDLSYYWGVHRFREDGWRFEARDNGGVEGGFDAGEVNHSLFANLQYQDFEVNALLLDSTQDFWGSTSSWSSGPDQSQRQVSSRRSLFDLGHQYHFADNQWLDSNISYSGSDFSHYNYDAKSQNWLGELTYHQETSSGAHWISGMTLWHQKVKTLPGLSAAPIPAFSRNWSSAYTQYQSLSNQVFNWTLGVQANKVPDVDMHYVPRASAVIQWSDNHGVKLNYASAFRAAYAVETNFDLIICCNDQGQNRGGLRGNPLLEPEEIETTEAQYFYQTVKQEFSATIFYSELTNLIERQRAADNVLDFINRGSLGLKGLELEGKVKIDASSLIFAYTYQENQSKQQENFTLMPNHMAKIGWSHSLSDAVNLGVFDSWFDAFHANSIRNPNTREYNQASSSYHMMTANLRYSFETGGHPSSLTLYGYNLLDEAVYQPEFAGRTINTQPIRAGRSWYLTYQLDL